MVNKRVINKLKTFRSSGCLIHRKCDNDNIQTFGKKKKEVKQSITITCKKKQVVA